MDALVRRLGSSVMAVGLMLGVTASAGAAAQDDKVVVRVVAPGQEGRATPLPSARRPLSAQASKDSRETGDDQAQVATAEFTRERLNEVLAQYPDSVGAVLKLDPSLLTNQSWMAPYPALSAFVAKNPEIVRNARYYLADVRVHDEGAIQNRVWVRSEAYDLWMRTLESFMIAGAFLLLSGVVVWIVRTILDHRRWNRLSKLQTDFQTKVFDRFSSNEELLAYIQTPAGRRLLEAAPVVPDQPADVGMPFRRILWAVQAGLVLVAVGIGFQFVSNRVPPEITHPLFVLGVLALSLGIGFTASAGVSFLLSRRLGLLQPPPKAAEPRAAAHVE